MDKSSMLLAKKPIILPSEDRNRMARLYEEVRIRLEEMAMITARTLKMSATRNAEVKFCPFPQGAEAEFEAIKLVRTQQGCGCYDYRLGACFEFEGAGSEACPVEKEG